MIQTKLLTNLRWFHVQIHPETKLVPCHGYQTPLNCIQNPDWQLLCWGRRRVSLLLWCISGTDASVISCYRANRIRVCTSPLRRVIIPIFQLLC